MTLAELKTFFAVLDDPAEGVTDPVRRALKSILLPAQTAGEVAGMMLSELHDLDGPAPHWIIPAERTKIKLAEHTVPLSPTAVQLIKDALADGRDETNESGRAPDR